MFVGGKLKKKKKTLKKMTLQNLEFSVKYFQFL